MIHQHLEIRVHRDKRIEVNYRDWLHYVGVEFCETDFAEGKLDNSRLNFINSKCLLSIQDDKLYIHIFNLVTIRLTVSFE